jgi:hypothetical protein
MLIVRQQHGCSGEERVRQSMAANNNSTTEVLAGLVERVAFHNEDNGCCVLRVKARGKREPITVVGHATVISAGEFIQASGEWANDRTHGVQFRVASYTVAILLGIPIARRASENATKIVSRRYARAGFPPPAGSGASHGHPGPAHLVPLALAERIC